ncbi:MBL fold metallo-hydrolase [bacterium]|nr:MBL fold metallo-hydrolase [bacterium]
MIRLAAHLFILLGAVNTGVLTSGDKAILFDCCDTVTLERLADIGINRVDKILCTQHRRSNISGAYAFVNEGTQLIVPAAERDLIAKPEEYWNNPKNRWHIYSFQPSPEVLISGLPVHKVVRENDVIEWEGYRIHVLDTPGATMGAVSYFVESDGKKFCFSGDVLYGPGQIWDFYSLQKGYKTRDYHAFLGNLPKLKLSLNKLEKCGATVLIPSHGKIINNPAEAARLTTERLDEVWRNYSCISSILYYFPNAMADGENDPDRMHPAPTHPEMSFLKRIPKTTTFVLKSLSGAALVIDCGKDGVVKSLQDMIKTGEISSVDGVWITHYHDDHVDGLQKLCKIFNCPVMTIENIVEILENFIIEQLGPIKEALNKLGRKRTGYFVGVLLFLACSIFLPILTNILTGIMELSVILLVFSIIGIFICGILFIIYQLRIRKKKKGVQG